MLHRNAEKRRYAPAPGIGLHFHILSDCSDSCAGMRFSMSWSVCVANRAPWKLQYEHLSVRTLVISDACQACLVRSYLRWRFLFVFVFFAALVCVWSLNRNRNIKNGRENSHKATEFCCFAGIAVQLTLSGGAQFRDCTPVSCGRHRGLKNRPKVSLTWAKALVVTHEKTKLMFPSKILVQPFSAVADVSLCFLSFLPLLCSRKLFVVCCKVIRKSEAASALRKDLGVQ